MVEINARGTSVRCSVLSLRGPDRFSNTGILLYANVACLCMLPAVGVAPIVVRFATLQDVLRCKDIDTVSEESELWLRLLTRCTKFLIDDSRYELLLRELFRAVKCYTEWVSIPFSCHIKEINFNEELY